MIDRLEELRVAGSLAPLDVHFARTIARLGGETRGEILLASALVSRQVREGHVCLDLRQLVSSPHSIEGKEAPLTIDWPALDVWVSALHESPLVGGHDAVTPLVLDDRGRLYLRRYWEHERVLAGGLQARIKRTESGADEDWSNQVLDRLFGGGESVASVEQRQAALVASRRHLCIISGGPGTGKTFTVVRMLALLIEQALHAGKAPPRIALAAPTGKAAARLNETIRRAKEHLPCESRVRDAVPENAGTIHRLLGAIEGSDTRFVHHRDNRLHADIVLVDEASMVDLALMRRLVEAVADDARLILLGDKDQLASVEAGAVLGDICNAGGDDTSAHGGGGIADCIVELTQNFRYSADSGIGALAVAIKEGRSDAALALLAETDKGLSMVEPLANGSPSESWLRTLANQFRPALQAEQGEESTPADEVRRRLQAFGRMRVLCAHRRGASGVGEINRRIEELLQEEGWIDPRNTNYAGRPIMVSRNDYQAQLFNGDVGMMMADGDDEGSLCAWFEGTEGGLRRLAPARLPPHETVFAMSIHKSQGSEFEEVAVVLPATRSNIVSRELLYTAVTRARARVSVCAPREVIAAAVVRRIERSSGLRDALWGPGSLS